MTVYSPSEDSWLLIDVLESLELEGKLVLDMGTGSGVVAEKMHESGAEVVAADLNPEAVEAARERLPDSVEIVESDLFETFENERLDLIAFNPPYLRGEEGVGDEEIWRGGDTGVEVAERFLLEADDHLASEGAAYVVLSSLSDYERLVEDFDLEIVESRELWFETLFVARYK